MTTPSLSDSRRLSSRELPSICGSLSYLLEPPPMQMSLPPLDLENSSPVIAHDVVQIPDTYSRYTNFKYRLWFTYYIYMYNIWDETAHSLQWLVTACVVNDLWFWEEEDEECIQEFAKALPLESFKFPETVMSMDSKYWDKACQDLGARRSQTMASPLAHVAPQIRLRFMAWLILAGLGLPPVPLRSRPSKNGPCNG
ncbi:hypothetical protein B0H13DRAFT_2359443 [Mycena leptocephala]|nr:hypothetical protein B0H13DRAFT_2359443 [Mycena leptocephala]